MPELPEVETVRRGLAEVVTGRQLKSVEVTGTRSVRRHRPRELARRLEGRAVAGLGRRGKYLMIGFEPPDALLVVHLGMSGQLLVADRADPVPAHTHVALGFEDGSEVRFVDPRTFGEVFVTEAGDGWRPAALAHLGFDPVEEPPGPAAFARLLAGRRTRLKALLLDQRFVAGLGNIYTDEILFAAGLRHDRPASSLDRAEAAALYRSMTSILREAIRRRGSSLSDMQYRDVRGRPGGYQSRHRVYDRRGEPCTRCGAPIERARAAGRSTYFCPRCQT
ncbi:MAG TPA: bifunctional DNA-formamidopyrimidine glycosylase/DNA-(apurinic or apyrimidinic site) lyase [Acidimicrobiales bacterium]|nr:bifunctional DNA-formamidopyrimidine glycosylase/DNA-(apurinic or apyrimidinic site) lyase [Acidimicrobiales bacterium]